MNAMLVSRVLNATIGGIKIVKLPNTDKPFGFKYGSPVDAHEMAQSMNRTNMQNMFLDRSVKEAFNSASRSNFNLCNKLYKEKNMNKFWNIIKKISFT